MKNRLLLNSLAVMIALMSASCSSVRCVEFTTDHIQQVGSLEGFPKQGYQGMSIWGDYLVSLQNTGLATLYHLTENGLKSLRQFPLASHHTANHANVADFGNERFDKDDLLPVLYVSQCSRQRYEGLKDVCFVERIMPDGAPSLCRPLCWMTLTDCLAMHCNGL